MYALRRERARAAVDAEALLPTRHGDLRVVVFRH